MSEHKQLIKILFVEVTLCSNALKYASSENATSTLISMCLLPHQQHATRKLWIDLPVDLYHIFSERITSHVEVISHTLTHTIHPLSGTWSTVALLPMFTTEHLPSTHSSHKSCHHFLIYFTVICSHCWNSSFHSAYYFTCKRHKPVYIWYILISIYINMFDNFIRCIETFKFLQLLRLIWHHCIYAVLCGFEYKQQLSAGDIFWGLCSWHIRQIYIYFFCI